MKVARPLDLSLEGTHWLCTTASERMKFIGIILSKEVKDSYTENCKMLKKVKKISVHKMIVFFHGLEDLILLRC